MLDSTQSIVLPSNSANAYENEAGMRDALWHTLCLNRDFYGEVAPDYFAGFLQVPWSKDPRKTDGNNTFLLEFNLMRTFNSELPIAGKKFRKYFVRGTDFDILMAGMKDGNDPVQRVFTTIFTGAD